MNFQRITAIGRQVLAVLVSVYGVLSASIGALHLPPAVSAVLVSFGPIILALEHYLGDPSTGSSTTTTPVAQKQTAPVPVQLVQQVPAAPVVQAPGNVATTPVAPVVVQPNPAPPAAQ